MKKVKKLKAQIIALEEIRIQQHGKMTPVEYSKWSGWDEMSVLDRKLEDLGWTAFYHHTDLPFFILSSEVQS